MNTENVAVETIFNAAKALPPESRAEYLNLACRDDAALRRELDRLLAAAMGAESFFEAKPVGLTQLGNTVMDSTIREGPGTRIGRYKLLQQIGEGGMGVVYMAEQEEPVRRRVALKIIKLGMDTRQVVARFEAERQALAMMDHPNIARVLDGGTTESGRPYFVMELVQGVSIIEFCDKARLSAKERLDLFLQVCEAVQSAHQKGIIHRDLKPSNILVTQHQGKPMPKVIDFGIAKATNQKLTEKTLFTQHATMIGTPAYMSPEQAEMSSMDVDTRSDIYSLGVLLYELLTGSTPFPEKRLRSLGYGEMQRVIAEEEPERPSARLSTLGHEQKTVLARNRGEELATLNSRLRGDLDWIVMKCLEKDRSRRYETANGLAADLKRHLDNEPVIARPPSLGYRVQKTVRRHRSAFATAGLVLFALLLGLGISVWQAVQKSRALARMTEAEQAQAHSREVAEKALSQEAQARSRVDELLERETAARRASEARLYATDIRLAQQALEKNNVDRARELLARHYPRPGETNRPGWEYRYLWQESRDDAAYEVYRGTNNTRSATGPNWLSVSPDGRRLVMAGGDATRAWFEHLDISDPRVPRNLGAIELPSPNAISAVALGIRDGWIAHAQISSRAPINGPRTTSEISIYDATTRRSLGTITNLPGKCEWLAWSGDGRSLLSVNSISDPPFGLRTRIDVWRVSGLTHVATLNNLWNLKRVHDFRFAISPDASAVAVAGPSYPLSVIDVATGATNWSFPSKHRGFKDLILAPDGRTLFVAEDADPGVIRTFHLLTGQELRPPLESSDQGELSDLVLAPDGRTLVARSSKDSQNSLCGWDVGAPSEGFKAMPSLRWAFYGEPIALFPKTRIVLAASGVSRLRALDPASEPQSSQPLQVTTGYGIATHQLGADSRTLLIAAKDGAVFERHGATFQSETPLFKLGRSLGRPVFSRDGRWFASGSSNGFVEVWNVLERRRVQQFGRYTGTVMAKQFSEDGSRLIVLDWANERYEEWDLGTSQALRTFPIFKRTESFWLQGLLSRGGQQLLTASVDGGFTWADTHSLEKREGDLGLQLVTALAFAPGAARFAAGSIGSCARIYDSRTFEPMATLGIEGDHIRSLQFLDRGDRLVLAGDQRGQDIAVNRGLVAIWDVATQLELVRLEAEGMHDELDVSPDGNVLITRVPVGDEPATKLHLWRAPSWGEIERAEAERPSVSAVRPR